MANIEFWTFSLAPWSERMCVCCCCCVQHNSPHHLLGSLLLTYHRLDKKLLIFSYSRGHNFTHILFYYIGYLITQKNASNLGQSKMFEIFVNNQRIWLNSCSKFGYEEYHLVADQLDFCSLKLNKKISNVECIINSKRNDKHCIGWGKRLNSKEVCLRTTIAAITSHTVISYISLANSKINSFGHVHVLPIGICACSIDILMSIPSYDFVHF